MGFFDLFRKKPRPPASVVQFDDDSIIHRRSDGSVETLRRDELEEVGIMTTGDGPMAEDIFWMLLGPGRTTGCAIPASAAGMDALLNRLQSLPEFDNEAVIQAMSSTTDARFVCWARRLS